MKDDLGSSISQVHVKFNSTHKISKGEDEVFKAAGCVVNQCSSSR